MTPSPEVLAHQQALAILSTYLLLASFVWATCMVIAYNLRWYKTGNIFCMLYGLTIWLLPMNLTLYAGATIFLIGLGSLIKSLWKWKKHRGKLA